MRPTSKAVRRRACWASRERWAGLHRAVGLQGLAHRLGGRQRPLSPGWHWRLADYRSTSSTTDTGMAAEGWGFSSPFGFDWRSDRA